ncbi:hypothetical protein D3C75_1071060 [compost metagenome]
MKVLITSHFCGTTPFTQKVVECSHSDLHRFFCEFNELEYPLTTDAFTVINDFGIFINDKAECCESWIRVDDSVSATVVYSEHAAVFMTGEQCRTKRKQLKWSQAELANRAGLVTMTIGRFENNPNHSMRSDSLKAIDRAFRNA